MRKVVFLLWISFLIGMTGCGGSSSGGDSGGGAPPGLSFSASPTTIQVSGSSSNVPQPATILLTLSGSVPAAGVYYGWRNTSNMIADISGTQTANNQATLTVTFNPPSSKPIGAYSDTIEVAMAYDKAGTQPIAGSPRTITITYLVQNSPASLFESSPASAWAGGPGFLLTVTGQGFSSNAQVQWNGSPLTTTWVSNTTLQAMVPASAIAQAGSAAITVGAQDLQTSEAMTFPVGNAQATTLEGGMTCAWDPAHGVLYTCLVNQVTAGAPVIQAIDPSTGKVLAQAACGSGTYPPLVGPSCIAVSDDGSYLYAFAYNYQLNVPGTIVRYVLPSLTLDEAFSIPLNTPASNWVMGMAVAPGHPHTLAVALGNGGNAAGVAIFDDNVARGSVVLNSAAPFRLTTLAWGTDASSLYVLSGAADNTYSLSTVAVTPSGPAVQVSQPVPLTGYGWDIHWVPATGHIYAGSGQVYDPATGIVVGTVASGGAPQALATDLTLGLGFYLIRPAAQPTTGYGLFEVASFDLTTLAPRGTTQVPVGRTLTGSKPLPVKALRCGATALVCYGGYDFLDPVYILSGPFALGK